MKIADLEHASGTPRSTIHLYRNLGLLPESRRLGPKLHVYDATHVERLAEIKRLRSHGLSLQSIRARLSNTEGLLVGERRAIPDLDRRSAIIQTAARRFVESGYDGVRLTDIAKDLRMSKAGLYRYFATKEELFVECIDQIRFSVVSAQERQGLTQLPDFDSRARARTLAVLHNFKTYRAMTQLLLNVAHGSQPRLAEKARDALHRMITGVKPDLDAAISAGTYRDADTEIHAYLLWGALMAAGDRLLLDDRYTVESAANAYLDLVMLGTRPRDPEASPSAVVELTDRYGKRIELALSDLASLRIVPKSTPTEN